MSRAGNVLTWIALAAVVIVPFIAASYSPLLAWREPIYIVAGFAGIAALALLLFQPLLAIGYLPGLSLQIGRRVHRWVGSALVLFVVFHVAGLWITSPPDVIDALLFSSPTPFSVWGVVAMWCIFIAALMAVLRRHLPVRAGAWRASHLILVVVSVVGSAVHAMKIEGTMEIVSKSVLCVAVLVVITIAVIKRLQTK